MSLTEKTIVKQIAILPELNTINVQWANQIFRNDELISEKYHRRAYSQGEKKDFLNEIENAQLYIDAVGW